MNNDEKNNRQFFKNVNSLKLELGDIVEYEMKKGKSLNEFGLSLRFQGNYRNEKFEEFLGPYLLDIDIIPYGTFIADTYDFSNELELVVVCYHFKKSNLYKSIYEYDEEEDIEY